MIRGRTDLLSALSSPPGVESPTYTGPLGPDLGDDTNMPEPVPTAPPLGNMDSIAGYGDVTFDAGSYSLISCSRIIVNTCITT